MLFLDSVRTTKPTEHLDGPSYQNFRRYASRVALGLLHRGGEVNWSCCSVGRKEASLQVHKVRPARCWYGMWSLASESLRS